MEYISTSGDDAGEPGVGEPQSGQIRRYGVPAGLNPEQRLEHWRTWHGSAVDTPMRLEKSKNQCIAIRLVHLKTSSAEFNFSGRSEVISPGSVTFLDLSADGGFKAQAGLGTVQINIDRNLLGLDEKVRESTTENGRYQGEPAGPGIASSRILGLSADGYRAGGAPARAGSPVPDGGADQFTPGRTRRGRRPQVM
jgi:hypothetical protein